jgi:hypothetical protein
MPLTNIIPQHRDRDRPRAARPNIVADHHSDASGLLNSQDRRRFSLDVGLMR